jgi:hypothetical protein
MQNQGKIPFPDGDIFICECGEELDLSEIRNNLYNINNIDINNFKEE